MKRYFVIALILLSVLVGTVTVSAAPPLASSGYQAWAVAEVVGCGEATISGTYLSPYRQRLRIELYLDGELVKSRVKKAFDLSIWFNATELSEGVHTVRVVGYVQSDGWSQRVSDSHEFTVDACHEYTIESHQTVDCYGYSRAADLYDFGVYQRHLLYEHGAFTDPYELEPGLRAVFFTIPSEYGGGTVDFDALSEPAACQIFRTYKAHQAYLEDECEGIYRVINLYEGPASDPYRTLVGTLYNETILFTDPYVLETIPAITIDLPEGYGGIYITFVAVSELEECPVVPEHEFEITGQVDCVGWGFTASSNDGGVAVPLGPTSGVWLDPYDLESASVSYEVTWPDGYADTFSGSVNEPVKCFACKVTEVYRQITLRDHDAPDWYYGRGSRNGSCWVAMTGEAEDAAGVAVFRQMDICSVCTHPDFIYEADEVLYDAYVTIDCNGKISYPDPLWKPEWFRPDYEELACHRQPSCINK